MSEKAKDPKVMGKKISHKSIDYEKLNRLTKDFGKRFSPQQELSAEQAFWFHILNPTIEPPPYIPPVIVDVPSELPKDTIKSLRENTKEQNVNHDKCELESIHKELENSVAKLLSKNEHLCNENNHVKRVFKYQFDSIKQTRVRHKEQSDSLINKLNLKSVENEDIKAQIQDKVFVITSLKNDLRKLKGKEIVENVVHTPSATTIAPGMFKLDLVPLPSRLLKNRDAHIDYLRHTQEQANTLREIVEQAKVKQPLDRELDFACKYATRIQELLVYVQDTCPNAITPSPKKVVVTPMNNVNKVRFAEPLTSSSNIKQVESSNTSDSNTPMLSSTGVNYSINCRSKPPDNKKNDRISQTPSRNKNKVEAQPRKVNKTNHVVKPICDVDVMHSLSKANSKILCAICNKSMFDGVYDKCLLDLVQNGNNLTNSAKKHKKQNIWQPTGVVFTEVGFKWKPIGRTFTIVDIPLSSSLVMTGFPDCTLVSGLRMFKTHDRESLLAHDFVSKFLVQNVRTDNGTEFVNQTLREFYENVVISHQTSVARTPQQNGVVKRRNRTLVEAARTMLIFSKAPLFLWAEAINTSYYTQNFPEAAAPRAEVLVDSPVSTSIDQDAPSTKSPKTPTFHDDTLNESPHEDSTSQGSSSNQLETGAMWCYFDVFLTLVELKNFKQAMTEPLWIDARRNS
ncbi:retrovirus-related pol polyprotein from transposon TNT 1-94 [Tanacetum coccineum]